MRAQGFDERFIRMWEFYLAYCEGGFRERSIGVAQLLLARPGYRRARFALGRPPGYEPEFGNLVGYQLVWFIAVIGAGRELAWPGLCAAGGVRWPGSCSFSRKCALQVRPLAGGSRAV